MSQFEVVSITLSFILGLSMSHILWTAASAVRARRGLGLHWIPFTWAGCIFFLHVQFFINARSIDLGIAGWTWSWYLTVLMLAVLLFEGTAAELNRPHGLEGGGSKGDRGAPLLLPSVALFELGVFRRPRAPR